MNYEYFKKELLNKKEEILKNIDKISYEIKDANRKCEIGDEADFANFNMNSSIDYELYQKMVKELKEIDEALTKIDNKTYGICEMCEDEIQEERLKVKPYAKYCIICREIKEKEGL